MFSLETHKNVPPKFSFALRDLAIFLGIFEMSEEELREDDIEDMELDV